MLIPIPDRGQDIRLIPMWVNRYQWVSQTRYFCYKVSLYMDSIFAIAAFLFTCHGDEVTSKKERSEYYFKPFMKLVDHYINKSWYFHASNHHHCYWAKWT
jgi:hypothetical protein